jgi:hypothetical protein
MKMRIAMMIYNTDIHYHPLTQDKGDKVLGDQMWGIVNYTLKRLKYQNSTTENRLCKYNVCHIINMVYSFYSFSANMLKMPVRED